MFNHPLSTAPHACEIDICTVEIRSGCSGRRTYTRASSQCKLEHFRIRRIDRNQLQAAAAGALPVAFTSIDREAARQVCAGSVSEIDENGMQARELMCARANYN
jgi:hypothetical protein